MKRKKKALPPLVTFEQRLAHGNLTVPEVLALAKVSRTKFYEDLKAGLVAITKSGRNSRIYGPVAVRYARGEKAV